MSRVPSPEKMPRAIGSTLFGLALALSFAGCATRYGPQDVWGEGYLERRVAPDRWEVLFDASVFTPPDKVARYALYRCAEITVADHAHYFVILSSGYFEITHADKTRPTLVDQAPNPAAPKPAPHSAKLLIQTFRDEKPDDYPEVYDARQLIEENASLIRETHKS
ncbi:MAG TPA: hypothetical protein VJA66_09705 [Thermoanaerobaculia bacterium]